jgi:hypothetical protein
VKDMILSIYTGKMEECCLEKFPICYQEHKCDSKQRQRLAITISSTRCRISPGLLVMVLDSDEGIYKF